MIFTTFRTDFHVGWKNQNTHSILNSSFDALSKWHEPDMKKILLFCFIFFLQILNKKKCFLSLILNTLFSFNLNRNEYRWLGWYECLGWKWLFLPFPKENRWESLSICQWCTRPAKHSMYCSKQVKTLMALFGKFWPI